MSEKEDKEMKDISWYVKPYITMLEDLKLDKETQSKIADLIEEVFADGIIAGQDDKELFEVAAEYLDQKFQN